MILVTGAFGFIGSTLVARLNQLGYTDLILVDRFGAGFKWKNILGLRFQKVVDRNQLFDLLQTERWASQITDIFHFGANTDTTQTDADYLYQWNVDYSIKLCNWAIARGIRFFYASSAAVYGDGALGFSDDPNLTFRLKPLNAYGFSKWLFDKYILENDYYEKVVGFRFFNVFGPNEYHKGRMASVVYHAFPQVSKSKKMVLFQSHHPHYKDGEQTRDFIYIDEVLDAIVFAFQRKEMVGIFNLGTEIPHTFYQLAEAVFKALETPVNIEYIPTPEHIREKYQYYTCADMSRWYQYNFPKFQDQFQNHISNYIQNYLSQGKYYSENLGL
ncbi:MAG: ADP-glyceromanno-heptose 6-epimerase [bacterium]|nr:ADP-glyceromanno-heptose 6-epimerase [bacterium]